MVLMSYHNEMSFFVVRVKSKWQYMPSLIHSNVKEIELVFCGQLAKTMEQAFVNDTWRYSAFYVDVPMFDIDVH